MMMCQTQLRLSFGGVTGFEHSAFVPAADALGLDRDVLYALLPYAESGMLTGAMFHVKKEGEDDDG